MQSKTIHINYRGFKGSIFKGHNVLFTQFPSKIVNYSEVMQNKFEH